jgi:hypothetical protein
VAKLTVDYNQNCLTLEEQETAAPEELAAFQAWLARRRAELELEHSGGLVVLEGESAAAARQRIRERPYLTTAFTALHFVTREAARDQLVGQTFGAAVLEQMQLDRAHIIRRVFGTLPLGDLSRSARTFNPYRLYHQYLEGGGVLLLPFRMLWGAVRGWFWILRTVVRNVRAIRNPGLTPSRPRDGYAPFEVAERKICRMRKPHYMAAMHTRARFDPEYLGLAIPGTQVSCPREHDAWADLARINALEEERRVIDELHAERRRSYRRFVAELDQRGFHGAGLVERLRTLGASPEHPYESIRAMLIAYLIDYRQAASLLHGEAEIVRIFEEALRLGSTGAADDEPEQARHRRRLGTRLAVGLRRDRREAFRRWWDRSALAARPRDEREICLEAYAANQEGVRDLLLLQLAAGGGDQARTRGWEILAEAARRPATWTEQIITLRTVQTLTVLDLQCYRRLVRELGRYEEDEPVTSG